MTLNLVKCRLWKGGTCTKPVPVASTTCLSGTGRLGQVVLVPVGQARCLYQTCPTGTGKGQKRPVPVPWTGHIPTLEACPWRRTGPMPTMEPVPVQLVPTCPTKWDYKAVEFFQKCLCFYGGVGYSLNHVSKRCPQVWPWFDSSPFSTNFVEFDQAV